MTAIEKYRKRWEDAGYFNNERVQEAEEVDALLKEHFDLKRIECIETGCSSNTYDNFGLYLLDLVQEKGGGSFSTVDIDSVLLEKSKEFLKDRGVSFHLGDSVEFLKNYSGSPTLVHLDSWDLDVLNPVPSMLHCWLEFSAIKDKVASGGIIMIDDNYFEGSNIEWRTFFDGKETSQRNIVFEAEVIGKGSMIYHWIKNYKTDWVIISNSRSDRANKKIVIKKK